MKARRTFHALGSAIGFLLALSITGAAMADDQRGTDNLPLVVKTIPDQKLPLIVNTSTDTVMVIVVGCVGVLQLVVFGIQSYLLWVTFLSSNLPKIIVRRIVIDAPNIDDRPVAQPFQKGDELRGKFAFMNIGRTKGILTSSYSMFFITDKALPMKPPYDGGTSVLLNTELKPGWGGSTSIVQNVTITDIPSDPHCKLYAMGWIDCVYKPPLIMRSRPVSRVHFCRVWSPSHYRFVPLDNPDYESEESA